MPDLPSSPRGRLPMILAIAATAAAPPRPALGARRAPQTAAGLCRGAQVSTIRLRFAPDRWAAIEPAARQDGGPGGMPPGPGMCDRPRP